MKKYLFTILMSLACSFGKAEIINEIQAKDVATRFFSSNSRQTRSSEIPLKLVWKGNAKTGRGVTSGTPAFYIYNRGNSQGFVIVSGENATRPILGYAFKGTFGVENMPENLKGWLNYLSEEIEEVRQLNLQPSEEVEQSWNQLHTTRQIVKMDTPEWNQDEPYNLKCPSPYEGYHFYTGCTITATSIILGYHQWPDSGVGELSGYKSGYYQIEVPGVTLGHPYLWSQMPYINGNELDQNNVVQGDAVATLMRDVGIMFRARYDYGATSAKLDNAVYKLPRHMKYHAGIMYLEKDYFSENIWQQMLKDELDAGRPILYAGYNSKDGHSFVVDGYDDRDCFSINWGWSGNSNGFYDLRSLHPGQQGPGGSTAGGYNQSQEAVLRIQPLRPNAVINFFEKMTFVKKNVAGSNVKMGLQLLTPVSEIAQGNTLHITAGSFANLGSDYFEGQLKLAITDANGKIKTDLYTTPDSYSMTPGSITLPLYALHDHYTFTLENPIAEGDRIRILYPAKDGQWKPITCDEPDGQWEIILKAGEATPDPIEVTTTAGMNLGKRALASFSAEVPTTTSANIQAFYAEAKDKNTIVLKKIESEDNRLVIPANTGVVLATDGVAKFTMVPTQEKSAHVPSSNILLPTSSKGIFIDPMTNAYILSKKNNNLLFFALHHDDRQIPANHSYLILPKDHSDASLKMVFDQEVTGIEDIWTEKGNSSSLYDLSGRKVSSIIKSGIYIKNGKKIFAK